MLKHSIDYLNAKLNTLGYFNSILCLAEKIEREERTYPALYNGSGEYVPINLDSHGSVSYWRKTGNVSTSPQENLTGIGVQYQTSIQLRLVGFIKKDSQDTQYDIDSIVSKIKSTLTVNNSALKASLKAKKVSVSSNKYETDAREVSKEEYAKVDFEARYTHHYFYIDFELVFIHSSECYINLCSTI